MKHPFIKSVLALSAALLLANCGDEVSNMFPMPDPGSNVTNPGATSPVVSGTSAADLVVNAPCWIFSADQDYIITTNLEVFSINGTLVGSYDPTGFVVSDLAGAPIAVGVDFNTLPLLKPTSTTQPTTPGTTNPGTTPTVGTSSAVLTPMSSASNGGQTPSPVVKSSSSVGGNNQQPASSAATQQPQQSADGQCFDKRSNKYVAPYTEQVGPNGEKYAYKNDCTIDCWWDGSNNNCAAVTSGSNGGQTTTRSSSSQQVRSSSSQQVVRSSSSQGNGGTTTGGTISSSYTIKYVSGGKSGSGWATRYWDCCKPHCAWPDKGGIKAHACDASGNRINDDGAKSMCDGGNAGICRGQFPIVVNDNLAFAFAAVPGSAGAQCGKCYDLAFTGKGKYATDNHKALAGKHLIVIASNIGYDVADGQFDIMIPGGGVGIFDGCSAKMGWGSQGARYGGLLTECEESSGYKASTYKSCLTNKCNTSFANDPEAKQGCLFLANWMNASGNPLHEYKEVECPKELLDRF